MPRFRVKTCQADYLYKVYEVVANSKEEAEDKALEAYLVPVESYSALSDMEEVVEVTEVP